MKRGYNFKQTNKQTKNIGYRLRGGTNENGSPYGRIIHDKRMTVGKRDMTNKIV